MQVCEAYGRFALHREALTNAGVTFSDQARRLLDWTTRVVLPALLSDSKAVKNAAAPFSDPNLSHILVERSFDFPISPAPTGPPKRRSKRDKTPVKLQDNSMNSRSSSIFDSPPSLSSPSAQDQQSNSSLLAKAFAVSMMQSCVVLFSEWLAVGGAGAEEISASAIEWISIFNSNKNKSTENTENNDDTTAVGTKENYNELIPAFSRLALQLFKTAENHSLLQKLIFTIQEDDDKNGILMKTLSVLLSNIFAGNKVVAKTVRCVLDSAHEHINAHEQFTITAETAQSFRSLCPRDCGCITPALNLIMSTKHGSLELAKMVADSFLQNNAVTLSDKVLMFNAHCLAMLFDSTPESSAVYGSVIRSLDINAMDPELAFVPVLKDLVVAEVPTVN